MILLTIGIPTYNRSKELDCLLSGILPECERLGIEILVSNNCSTDNTSQILEKYCTYHCLVVNNNQENVGFDRNLLKLFELANGSFLWTVGDDEQILAQYLKDIVNILSGPKKLGLVFANYSPQHYFRPKKYCKLKPIIIGPQQYADQYLHKAALISANIMNLAEVKKLKLNMETVSHGWVNLHILLKLIDQLVADKCEVCVIKDVILVQGVETGACTVERWENVALGKFGLVLQQTPLNCLKTDKFRRHYYDLVVRPVFLNGSRLLKMDNPIKIYFKIIQIFNPVWTGRLSFWLHYLLLWKTVGFFRRNGG